jgi:hypothetical protein
MRRLQKLFLSTSVSPFPPAVGGNQRANLPLQSVTGTNIKILEALAHQVDVEFNFDHFSRTVRETVECFVSVHL